MLVTFFTTAAAAAAAFDHSASDTDLLSLFSATFASILAYIMYSGS